MNNRTLKAVGIASAFIAGSFLIDVIKDPAINWLFSLFGEPVPISQEHLLEIALAANQQLPKVIDEATRLDAVTVAPGKNVIYAYTLLDVDARTWNEQDLDDLAKALRQENLPTICGGIDARLRSWIEQGVRLTHQYRDTNGRSMVEINADADLCPTPWVLCSDGLLQELADLGIKGKTSNTYT